jgi:hypothetical protein
MDPVAHRPSGDRNLASAPRGRRPARPSPTIATAITAKYEHLDVYCEGCRQKVSIPWALIRRPPETVLADLAGDLTCERCGPKGPLPKILGVSRRRAAQECP